MSFANIKNRQHAFIILWSIIIITTSILFNFFSFEALKVLIALPLIAVEFIFIPFILIYLLELDLPTSKSRINFALIMAAIIFGYSFLVQLLLFLLGKQTEWTIIKSNHVMGLYLGSLIFSYIITTLLSFVGLTVAYYLYKKIRP